MNIEFVKSIPRFALPVLLCIGQAGCVVATEKTSAAHASESTGEWATHLRTLVDGCQVIESFSAPRYSGQACVSEVTLQTSCPNGVEIRKSKEQYFAFPLEIGSGCSELRANRDFFPAASFGRDHYFLVLLRQVALILRSEASSLSPELRELGNIITDEITTLQMTALSGLQLDPASAEVDRYRVLFYLPIAQSTVVLFVNADGSEPEWALLLK